MKLLGIGSRINHNEFGKGVVYGHLFHGTGESPEIWWLTGKKFCVYSMYEIEYKVIKKYNLE